MSIYSFPEVVSAPYKPTHRGALLALQAKVVGDGLVIRALVIGSDKNELALEGLGNSAQSSKDRRVGCEISRLGPEDELLLDARVENLVGVALAELNCKGHLLGCDESLNCITLLKISRVDNDLTGLA